MLGMISEKAVHLLLAQQQAEYEAKLREMEQTWDSRSRRLVAETEQRMSRGISSAQPVNLADGSKITAADLVKLVIDQVIGYVDDRLEGAVAKSLAAMDLEALAEKTIGKMDATEIAAKVAAHVMAEIGMDELKKEIAGVVIEDYIDTDTIQEELPAAVAEKISDKALENMDKQALVEETVRLLIDEERLDTDEISGLVADQISERLTIGVSPKEE